MIATLHSVDTDRLIRVSFFCINVLSWLHRYWNVSQLIRKFSIQSYECCPKLLKTTSSHHGGDCYNNTSSLSWSHSPPVSCYSLVDSTSPACQLDRGDHWVPLERKLACNFLTSLRFVWWRNGCGVCKQFGCRYKICGLDGFSGLFGLLCCWWTESKPKGIVSDGNCLQSFLRRRLNTG